MKKIFLLFCSLFISNIFYGQVNIPTIATTYSQNFNTLAETGTSNTFSLSNWFSNKTTYIANGGATNNGGLYSFGTTAADRSLGSLGSQSAAPITYGTGFTNSTGSTITSLTITYRGELWRLGTALLNDRLFFQYNTISTSGTDLLNWVNHTPLDFQSPTDVGTTDVARDGNAAPNFGTVTATLNVSIPNNGKIWIRWLDSNSTGSDCALSIDDLTVSFAATTTPCVVPASNPASIISKSSTSTSYTASFSPVASASGYLVVSSTSATLSAAPQDGTVYGVGTSLGGGTVVSNGSSTSFTATGLTANTNYNFFIFAYNNAGCINGPVYKKPATTDNITTKTASCDYPQASATNLVFTNVTNTSISGSFTAPNPVSDSVLIMYSVNSTVDFPRDSQFYAVGSTIGTGTREVTILKKIKNGDATTFTVSGLSTGVRYYFWVMPFNFCTTNGEQYYRRASTLRADTVTGGVVSCAEPTSSATNLVFTNVTNTSIAGSYTLPTPASDSVLVLYSTNSFVAFPQDGIAYSNGQVIGTGTQTATILTKTKVGTTFTASGLSTGVRYYFWIIPYNFCTPGNQLYKQTAVLRLDTVTGGAVSCVEPTASATNLVFTNVTNTSIAGSYTLPSPASDSILVLYSTNSFVAFPQDGIAYSNGQVIGTGTQTATILTKTKVGTTFTASGLSTGVRYYFWIIPYNFCTPGNQLYKQTAVLRLDTVTGGAVSCAEPTSSATNLVFTNVTNTSIAGSYTLPTPASDSILVLYSTNSFVAFPQDGIAYSNGQVIGTGTQTATILTKTKVGTTFTASGLMSDSRYYFWIIPYNFCTPGNQLYKQTAVLRLDTVTGTTVTNCVAPTAATAVNVAGITASSLSGTISVGSASGYLYIVSQGTFNGTIINGTNYIVGQTIGNGTVFQNNSSTTWSVSGLNPNTSYAITVYAYNNTSCTGGPAYSTIRFITQSTAQGTCLAPSSNPSPITFTNVSGTNISGSFTANGSTGYVVFYSTVAANIPNPANGTSYTVGNQGLFSVASFGAGTTFSISTALNTKYYFKVFAYNNTACVFGPTYNTTAVAFDTTTQLTNSIAQAFKGPQFSIYPNPSMKGSNTFLKFDQSLLGDVAIKVIATNGAVVQDMIINMQNDNVIELNTQSFAKGMYQILLQHDGKFSSNKIILQ